MPDRPGFRTLLGRGLRKKCAVCGGGGLFDGWLNMKERCPTCGFKFEREDGFFLGAFVVNAAVTEFGILVVLVACVALTLPDPPLYLLVAAITAAVVVPIVTYPFSKTVWSAIDLGMHPLEDAPTEG